MDFRGGVDVVGHRMGSPSGKRIQVSVDEENSALTQGVYVESCPASFLVDLVLCSQPLTSNMV